MPGLSSVRQLDTLSEQLDRIALILPQQTVFRLLAVVIEDPPDLFPVLEEVFFQQGQDMVTEHDRQRLRRHHRSKPHKPSVTKTMFLIQQHGDTAVYAVQQVSQGKLRPLQAAALQ